MKEKLMITAESSHGDFTFDETGRIVDSNLADSFVHLPILSVDMESINMDDVHMRLPRDGNEDHGDMDILYVGYFYRDEYGRRQYEPKLDDPRCPFCDAAFGAHCECFPKVFLSERNTMYLDREELTQQETIDVMNPVKAASHYRKNNNE